LNAVLYNKANAFLFAAIGITARTRKIAIAIVGIIRDLTIPIAQYTYIDLIM
jgi:hypothetical protein